MVNGREGLNRLHFHNHGLLYDEVNFERGLNRHIAIYDINRSLRLHTKRARPQFYNQASVLNRFEQAGSQRVVYGNRAPDDLFGELLEVAEFNHASELSKVLAIEEWPQKRECTQFVSQFLPTAAG
jgi:hypothetical protein